MNPQQITATFTVHARLMQEATDRCTERAVENIGRAVEGLRREIEHEMRWVAQNAYQQGVRDGYVQAVAGEPT